MIVKDLKHMSGKETMSKEELETLKKQWLEEMKANMKVEINGTVSRNYRNRIWLDTINRPEI
jgi:hypothetical protein